jgi:signal transduction histidine kinase
MTNAIDAMPAGGTLQITALPTSKGVRIEVADTGHGIPADLLSRLFEPFVTTKPEGYGTGLGLGIVREVIQTHGGEISVTSEPGMGTVFTIDLPVSSVETHDGEARDERVN